MVVCHSPGILIFQCWLQWSWPTWWPTGSVQGSTTYITIHDAINAANYSNTTNVYPGTYTENVDVSKKLNIISEFGIAREMKENEENEKQRLILIKCTPLWHHHRPNCWVLQQMRHDINCQKYGEHTDSGDEVLTLLMDTIKHNTDMLIRDLQENKKKVW